MLRLASLNNRLLLSDGELDALEEKEKESSRPYFDSRVLVASCHYDDESATQFTSTTLSRAVEEAAQRQKQFRKFNMWTQDLLEEVRETTQQY